MGDPEPIKETETHELLVVVAGVAGNDRLAEEVTLMGMRQIFCARPPWRIERISGLFL